MTHDCYTDQQGRLPCTCAPVRTCAELGVCQGRTPPCRDECENPAIYLGGLQSMRLNTENSDGSSPDLPVTMHDTPLDHARTLFLAIALVAFAGCVGLIVMAVLK